MPFTPTTTEVLAVLDRRPLHPQTLKEIAHTLAKQVNATRDPALPTLAAGGLTHVLDLLREADEVVEVSTSHWSVNGWRDGDAQRSYYLSRATMEHVAQQADQREIDLIKDRAEEHATQTIVNRHRDEWREERDMLIAAVTPPDHASLWEA